MEACKGWMGKGMLYQVDFTVVCCFLDPCVSYMDFLSPDLLLQGGEDRKGGVEK